ncbi:hypothetical protein MNBD_GAMMA12-2599 [hydrothermal vent metagenome]|uniref:Uncharacterized protein n=1 Tax=hydrothermal vent metagenome TaxID=652676 RepID=A0A3B0YNL0_9ZZZZ
MSAKRRAVVKQHLLDRWTKFVAQAAKKYPGDKNIFKKEALEKTTLLKYLQNLKLKMNKDLSGVLASSAIYLSGKSDKVAKVKYDLKR